MGRKSARAGKFFYLCVAVFMSLCHPGCQSSQKTVTARAEITGEKKPQPGNPPAAGEDHLSQARALMARGDYEGALREDLRALKQAGKYPPADEALFHLGLIHSHPANPGKDFHKALSYFHRLVGEHPASLWAEQARVWVALLRENERLHIQLEQSKKVDLEVEEKKRERGGR